MITIHVKTSGTKTSQLRLREIEHNAANLPVAFARVADWFYHLERRRFDHQGFGTWPALSRRTKARRPGHYRVMRRTDALYRSLTVRAYRGSVRRITSDRLEIGTRIPYARHQDRRRKLIALRPVDRRELRAIIADHLTA